MRKRHIDGRQWRVLHTRAHVNPLIARSSPACSARSRSCGPTVANSTRKRRATRPPNARCGGTVARRIHPHAVQSRGPNTARYHRRDFETAITWDRFPHFHARVRAATEQAIREVTGKPGLVTCRFTHVYPDGPAPYFSFHAAGDQGGWSIYAGRSRSRPRTCSTSWEAPLRIITR